MSEQVTTLEAPTRAANKGGATLSAASDAIHSLSTTGTPNGGQAIVTWPGYPSVTVAYNKTAVTLQTALDAVFGAGQTVAAGGPWPGTPLTVTFEGTLANETVPTPTVDDTGLSAASGTPHAHVTITAPGDGSHLLVDENVSREALLVSTNVADAWLEYGPGPALVGQGHCVRAGSDPFIERSWKGKVHVASTGAAQVGYTERVLSVGDDEGERPVGYDTNVPAGPSDTAIPPPTAPPPGTPVE